MSNAILNHIKALGKGGGARQNDRPTVRMTVRLKPFSYFKNLSCLLRSRQLLSVYGNTCRMDTLVDNISQTDHCWPLTSTIHHYPTIFHFSTLYVINHFEYLLLCFFYLVFSDHSTLLPGPVSIRHLARSNDQ